jgi:peptidoglycan LD-endopeptidase CwlK
MFNRNLLLSCLLFFSGISHLYAEALNFNQLEAAYPDTIQEIKPSYIVWKDGSKMLIRRFPLIDLLIANANHVDLKLGSISLDDVQHDSYEPFFRKMYGNSPAEVKKNLVTIYWMSKVYGKQYPLKVTTVNGVDKKLLRISAALEKLPATFYKYVKQPASSYYWRNVAKETYLSLHSFGIAIDINVSQSNYWMWDLERSKKTGEKFHYRNCRYICKRRFCLGWPLVSL